MLVVLFNNQSEMSSTQDMCLTTNGYIVLNRSHVENNNYLNAISKYVQVLTILEVSV